MSKVILTMLSFQMGKREHIALKKACRDAGVSMSQFIREAIRKAMK